MNQKSYLLFSTYNYLLSKSYGSLTSSLNWWFKTLLFYLLFILEWKVLLINLVKLYTDYALLSFYLFIFFSG